MPGSGRNDPSPPEHKPPGTVTESEKPTETAPIERAHAISGHALLEMLKTAIPVSTSLAAAIATALVAVPLASNESELRFGHLPVSRSGAAALCGGLSVAFFLAATVLAVWCIGKFTGEPGEEELTGDGAQLYEWLLRSAMGGLCFLALTFGLVGFDATRATLPMGCGLGAAIGLVGLIDNREAEASDRDRPHRAATGLLAFG
ncbi:MAG: hypothetical protein AB7L13_06250 [Acidimicrobiia bacterium]